MTDDLERRVRDLEKERSYWSRTSITRANEIAVEMMKLSEGAGPVVRALALRAYGNSLRTQGRLEEALSALQEAQALWRSVGDEVEWARSIIGAVPVLVQLERHGEAIKASHSALDLLMQKGELAVACRLLSNMGAMYGNLGQPHAALDCLTRGLELARQTGQPSMQAMMSQNRALVLQELGRHRESLSDCALALQYYSQEKASISIARTLQTGAIGLFQLGHFGKALRRFARARTLFEQQSSQRDVAVCDLYIAACYLELNRCDQTLIRTRMVMEVLAPAQYGFQHAWAHLYEGVALGRLGRSEEALRSLTMACRWFEQHGHRPWAGKARLEEAELLLARGRPRDASRTAARAARLFATDRMPVEEARAHLVRAESSLAAERLSDAETAARSAYRIFSGSHMPGLKFRCLQVLGRAAMQRGDWASARRLLTHAVNSAERIRAAVHLPFRRAFLDDKASAYADLAWVYLNQGQVRQAHRLADLAKSRSLVDVLTASPYRRLQPSDPDEQRLAAEMAAVRREYQELTAPAQFGPEVAVALRSGSVTPAERRAQLEARLAALWDEWELRQTTRRTPGGDKPAGRRPPARALSAGAAMVEYFNAGGHLIAFVSDRRGLRGWMELGAPETVRRTIELLQLNLDTALLLAGRGQAVAPALDRNARALLGQMCQQIWVPLLPLLGERRAVVIVPYGLLHLVPFEALHDGERYLVEYMEITLAPSRAVWGQCVARGKNHTGAADLVIGYNPEGALPFVDTEARTVAESLGAAPLLAGEATAAKLAGAGTRRVLHVAVHGEFRQDNPYFSTLLLADGRLTAADVAGLGLANSLVVLSGCETGISRVTRGDELMGMVTAFLQAGSASVLASRWRVDDRMTADLMLRFYAGLLSGRSKAAALREAQAAVATGGVHPLYWAAFGLVGHGGPLNEH